MIVTDNLIFNKRVDNFELNFMIMDMRHDSTASSPQAQQTFLINSSPTLSQQNSQNLFKLAMYSTQHPQSLKTEVFKVEDFLMLSDAVSYDFKLVGIMDVSSFRFDDIMSVGSN